MLERTTNNINLTVTSCLMQVYVLLSMLVDVIGLCNSNQNFSIWWEEELLYPLREGKQMRMFIFLHYLKTFMYFFLSFFFQLKSERITINYSMVPLISKRYINFIKYRVLFAKEVEQGNTHVLIMI